MTFLALLRRSLRFHARGHLGVVMGVAIGSATLTGALMVGDSVRGSLRERALQRLVHASFALAPPDRLFSQHLSQGLYGSLNGTSTVLRVSFPQEHRFSFQQPLSATLLSLAGTAAVPDGAARANQIQVWGVDQDFWAFAGVNEFVTLGADSVVLNPSLAAQLHVQTGDEVLLRVAKPRQLSAEAAVTQRSDQMAALRLKVAGVLPAEAGGNLLLHSAGSTALNAFVAREDLAARVGTPGKANVLLLGQVVAERQASGLSVSRPSSGFERVWNLVLQKLGHRFPLHVAPTQEALAALEATLRSHCTASDLDFRLPSLPAPFAAELRSPRVFLDPPVAAAAAGLNSNSVPLLTYLANLVIAGTNATSYSMVTAAGPPYTPAGMRDDEILVNQWLADDLDLHAGDIVRVVYFLPESGGHLQEDTNQFRVRGVVPLGGIYADRTLMPDFPGIEKADSTRDWDAGFPLVYRIRTKDEQYWKDHRGTPKAFVTLAAGQALWGNRFGELTAIRFPPPSAAESLPEQYRASLEQALVQRIDPVSLGLRFEAVREQALRAAEQSQDFGQLFLGFSFFLLVSAMLLVALLFQFQLEQRAPEIGTLLALGFTPGQVRRLLLVEATVLAFLGASFGLLGGLAYARAMLWGLATLWRDAVGGTGLGFQVELVTCFVGLLSGAAVAVLTVWLTLRRQARQPAYELLAGAGSEPKPGRSRGLLIAIVSGLCGLGVIGWGIASGISANAEAFFGAGSLLLIAGLAAVSAWLASLARRSAFNRLTVASLGVRGCARRRKRSVAAVALLASGCFLVASIGAFRLDSNQTALQRSSGTGGFALIGETTVPVVEDLNRPAGREAYGLDTNQLADVALVPFRVRAGDEASCLNLNRAQQPRVLGVDPARLAGRFTFVAAAKGADRHAGWNLLLHGAGAKRSVEASDEIPAIGDANSIQWALGKAVGDAVDYTDERGRRFKLRLVGAVANSILQGSLVIDEARFRERFPGETGYRWFLIDAPPDAATRVSAALSRALQDSGLAVTPAARRLNEFNAVQNTYLGTFQLLGGLGLLLGSAGLGVIVLRNVLERRGELGVLVAVGFQSPALQRLVLSEHAALLGLGLGIGLAAAAVAVLPALLEPGAPMPYGSLAVTLAAVLVNGLVWTVIATRYALRGNLLDALRNE
jgi:putative ABC transport system permease protein